MFFDLLAIRRGKRGGLRLRGGKHEHFCGFGIRSGQHGGISPRKQGGNRSCIFLGISQNANFYRGGLREESARQSEA